MNQEKIRKVLSFKNYCLTTSDLKTIEPAGWVNGSIIGFFIEYLAETYPKPSIESRIYICDPLFSAFLLYEDDPETLFECLSPLNLASFSLLLFPVNTKESKFAFGGEHWTLLGIFLKEKNVVSLNSLDFQNKNEEKLLRKLVSFLSSKADFTRAPTILPKEKQKNSFDCGVYLMVFLEKIWRQSILKEKELRESIWPITPEEVSEKRRAIHDLILVLGS